ncbi:uncharacterized protein PAC_02302 [Phialocephala subalpina]|uniref:C2H2-type domain-containing protein n=1 Tax=Phialocephala subalpina TaxID=576137 RepID=A0A1L7WI20_9HELO|nr:uncharacterized protein PAC_02302 [Phialocephala subalpina]
MQSPALSPSSPSQTPSKGSAGTASSSASSYSASLSPAHHNHSPVSSIEVSPDAVPDWYKPFVIGSHDTPYSTSPYPTSTAGVDPFDPSFLANDGAGLLSDFHMPAQFPALAIANGGYMPAALAQYNTHTAFSWMNDETFSDYQMDGIAAPSMPTQSNPSTNGSQFSNAMGYPSGFAGNVVQNLQFATNQDFPATFQLIPNREHFPLPQKASSYSPKTEPQAMQPAPHVQANIQSAFRNQKHHCLWSAGCTKSFARFSDLERHWYSVHLGQKLHCTFFGCSDQQGKGFSRIDKLRKHQKDNHGIVLV